MVDAAAWVHRRAGVCVHAHTCLFSFFVSLFVCVGALVCVCFSTVLHASFARLRDGVESSRSARPAVLGVLSGPVPCRDPALPEPVSTRGVRTPTCCAAPSISTHARTCTQARTHTGTSVRARAEAPRHIGSAAPGRPSQLKRRLLTGPLAHASITRRARAADAFAVWGTRQVRVAAEGRRLQLLQHRRGGEVRE